MSRVLLPTLLLVTETISSSYFYPIFALVLGYLLWERRRSIPISAVKTLAPLILIVVVNIVFIDSRDALRDFWYFSKIILITLSGLLLGMCYKIDSNWFSKLTLVTLILTALNLFFAVTSSEVVESRNLSFVAALMGPFILSYHSKSGNLARVIRALVILIVIGMIILSESRAGLLTLIVAYLVSRGVFQRTQRVFLVGIAIAVFLFLIWPYLPQYDIGNITFLGKVRNSINELAFNTGEDRIEMYSNWRGFEAYRAYQTWLDAPLMQKLVGLGFGERIDLGKSVAYGNAEVSSLPFVHNAYFTLLVKVGVLGIAIIVYILLLPFRIPSDQDNRNTVVLKQISIGTAIVLLLTTALNAGPLNKESMDGLLLIWAWSSGALYQIGRQVKITRRNDDSVTNLTSFPPKFS